MPGPAFLEGESVDLRTFEEEDVEFLRDTVNDARVWKSLGGQVTPTSLAMERRFFEKESRDDATIRFVVTSRDGDEAHDGGTDGRDGVVRVGMVELNDIEWDRSRAEVAFWIAPAHQDAGYARDALSTLVDYAFDQLGLHKLTAEAFATNEASMRLLESIGFEREGRFRAEEYVDGEWVDVVRYGLLAAERDGDSGR
jgi:RimJ/RimL family protein N-acetyltransferase